MEAQLAQLESAALAELHAAGDSAAVEACCRLGLDSQEQPAAMWLRKQAKSLTFRTGEVVLPSQFA